jgi:RNA polymerase sigma-70 factor (ECF subfamily)
MVLGVCRRLLADPAEAEDAMQQTFLSAYRSMLAGDVPRRADVWLAAIARNECLDRIRARMREPLAEPPRNGVFEGPDALSALIAEEELRTLAGAIRELPDQQRDALVLHELCGLRYDQVAATIGVSEPAIRSLLFRARRRLRSALQRAYGWLPLPAFWDTFDHLFGRSLAVKIAALPAVAKLGAGLVAVGVTAGAVVAVQNNVPPPKSQPPPAGASNAGAPTVRREANPPVRVVAQPLRLASPAVVRSIVPARNRTASPVTKPRRANRVPREAPASSDQSVPAPTTPTDVDPSTTPTHVGRTDEPPVVVPHGRSHASAIARHHDDQQRLDPQRATGNPGKGKPPPKKPHKPSPRSQEHASTPGGGAGRSNGNDPHNPATDEVTASVESQQNGNGVGNGSAAGASASPDASAGGESAGADTSVADTQGNGVGHAYANGHDDDHGHGGNKHSSQ